MRRTDDELRAALRAEAAAHRPDREAMLDRIGRATAGSAPARRPVLRARSRTAAAAAAVAALLAGGGAASWALAGSTDDTAPAPPAASAATAAPPTVVPAPVTPATTRPATTQPAPTRPATAGPASAGPATKAPAPAEPTPSRATPSAPPGSVQPSAPGDTGAEQGPLRSAGTVDRSGDTRGASIVTLRTTEPLSALEVVIRVARTEGLVSRGGTKRTPGVSVTTSVTETPDALLYRFTLASADTLDPGTYTFTARYSHPPGGRDPGRDTYRAVSGSLAVRGGFAS